jgi:hypothetical protein
MLGDAQLRLRKVDDAERSLALAAKLAPDNADVWNNLGLVSAGKRRLARRPPKFRLRHPAGPAPRGRPPAPRGRHPAGGDRRAALALYRDYLAVAPNAANAEEIRALIRQLDPPANAPAVAAALTNAAAAARPITNAPATSVTKAPATTQCGHGQDPAARRQARRGNASGRRQAQRSRPCNPAAANPPVSKPAAATRTEPPKSAAPAEEATPDAPEVVRVNDGPTLHAARMCAAGHGARPGDHDHDHHAHCVGTPGSPNGRRGSDGHQPAAPSRADATAQRPDYLAAGESGELVP